MNSNYDRKLEELISRELKALPPLKAPAGLHSTVMAAIKSPTAPGKASWFSQSPATMFATVLVLSIGFAALCYAGWETRGLLSFGSLTRHMSGVWSTAGMLGNFLETLGSALVLILKNLNVFVITSLFVFAALVYFLWVAMGALWFKIAFATR